MELKLRQIAFFSKSNLTKKFVYEAIEWMKQTKKKTKMFQERISNSIGFLEFQKERISIFESEKVKEHHFR